MSKNQKCILDIFENKSVFRTAMRKESDSLLHNTGFGLQYYVDPNHEVYFTIDYSQYILKINFCFPDESG